MRRALLAVIAASLASAPQPSPTWSKRCLAKKQDREAESALEKVARAACEEGCKKLTGTNPIVNWDCCYGRCMCLAGHDDCCRMRDYACSHAPP